MRLTILKEYLVKALNDASHAINPKNPIPVLANFKIELNERGLEVTGSNNEITIRAFVPYEKDGKQIITGGVPGNCLINAHLALETVRSLAGTTISLDIIDNITAKIYDGITNFKLNCTKGDEYPDVDFDEAGTEITLSSDDLSELVNKTAFAAATKELRPALTAVNLEATNGDLIATAMDSARLAMKTLHLGTDATFRTNIPAKALMDIVRLTEGSGTVRLVVSEKKALFFFGGNIISTRLIPGEYQVKRSIVPTICNYRLQVNSQELLSAMSRISILSADRESVVKLSMSEDHVEVSVKSDRNGSGNEPIKTFQFDGDPLEVSFNSLFVIDAIKALKSEDVTLCFQAEMKLFVVKNPLDDSAVELITPMRSY